MGKVAINAGMTRTRVYEVREDGKVYSDGVEVGVPDKIRVFENSQYLYAIQSLNRMDHSLLSKLNKTRVAYFDDSLWGGECYITDGQCTFGKSIQVLYHVGENYYVSDSNGDFEETSPLFAQVVSTLFGVYKPIKFRENKSARKVFTELKSFTPVKLEPRNGYFISNSVSHNMAGGTLKIGSADILVRGDWRIG